MPISKSSAIKLFHAYKGRAARRGQEWGLTLTQFLTLTKGNCYLCGVEPSQISTRKNYEPYIYNGIDRKDSSLGYVAGNVASCCWPCNRMKSAQKLSDFRTHIKKVAEMDQENTQLPIVEVIWIDAYSTDGWADLEEHAADEPARVRSVGFLLKDTKTHLVLIGSTGMTDGTGFMSLKIPKGMVETWHYLEFDK